MIAGITAWGASSMSQWPDPETTYHTILVNHTQAAEPHVYGIVIVRKGKCMVTIEPAVVRMAAFDGPSECDHIERFAFELLKRG